MRRLVIGSIAALLVIVVVGTVWSSSAASASDGGEEMGASGDAMKAVTAGNPVPPSPFAPGSIGRRLTPGAAIAKLSAEDRAEFRRLVTLAQEQPSEFRNRPVRIAIGPDGTAHLIGPVDPETDALRKGPAVDGVGLR